MKNKNTMSADALHKRLLPLIDTIEALPIYNTIQSLPTLQTFMEHHIFAVWDFMCLLKTLYGKIVDTSSLWLPPKDGLSSHLIGSILVEEESDLNRIGDHASHFETYFQAMHDIQANTLPITTFLKNIAYHKRFDTALRASPIPRAAQHFMQSTFSLFERDTHEIAAAFVFGREAITGAMFYKIIQSLKDNLSTHQQPCLKTLLYYLERHIELDSDEHLPKALKILDHLCGHDKRKWQQAEEAARFALQARIEFFTDIHHVLCYSKHDDAMSFSQQAHETR